MDKNRSYNFTYSEKQKLRFLIDQHPIISSKKTDALSAKLKDAAWSDVTTEFNKTSTTYRNKKQLINKFNNLKKFAKYSELRRQGLQSSLAKKMSGERKERSITDKEPSPPPPTLDMSEWMRGKMKESMVKQRREEFILKFAEEEHRLNIEHKKELYELEMYHMRQKIEIEKQKLINLKLEEGLLLNNFKNTCKTSTST